MQTAPVISATSRDLVCPPTSHARYERMRGNDVLMVSGTDEHGTPILVEAEKEGLTAQELANRYNRVIAKDLCDLGLSYPTCPPALTTGNDEHVVQEDVQAVLGGTATSTRAPGRMRRSAPSTGRTLPDRYIEGECPICHAEGARWRPGADAWPATSSTRSMSS